MQDPVAIEFFRFDFREIPQEFHNLRMVSAIRTSIVILPISECKDTCFQHLAHFFSR